MILLILGSFQAGTDFEVENLDEPLYPCSTTLRKFLHQFMNSVSKNQRRNIQKWSNWFARNAQTQNFYLD